MATSITNTSITTDDLTVDTNVLKVDSTNNRVGINTTSGPESLNIGSGGNLRFQTTNTVRIEYLNTTGAYALGTTGGAAIGFNRPATGDDEIFFETHNGGVSHAERMRIDKDGHVTTPKQPSFLMKKYSGGATAIANNSVWTYDEALSNVGSHANISNGRFTAPVAGSYCFMWHNIGEGTGTVYRSFIRKNGSGSWGTGSYRLESRNFHSGGYPNASAQVVVALAATDYVDIYLEGGAIYSDATNGVWFCGFLIG